MRRKAFLLGGLLFCHPVMAIELADSNFSVDPYRFYFQARLTDIPPAPAEITFNLYAVSTCVIVPPDHELFQFSFMEGSGITETPEVTTTGTPASDRWADGPTDHLSLITIDFGEEIIEGSIRNGADAFQPGDRVCMRLDYPGGAFAVNGLVIEETPEASVYLKKTSTAPYVSHVGQVVPYSYRIENTSPVFLHDVSLSDDNVDEPPVCEYGDTDVLAPEGQPGAVLFCTARHTVTAEEIEAEQGVSNTATVNADELDPVMVGLTLPVRLFSDGFENPANTITVLDPVGAGGVVAIGGDGRPVIAYEEQTANDLYVAQCLDTQCTAATLSMVDGGENQVGGASLAIGDDGLPIISYFDRTDGVLMAAKCNDEACAGGDETISVVDGGNTGSDSSIAIGNDGLPIISYRDRANGTLKVAHCNDAACTGGDETITTIADPESSVGLNTSIAIGDDGLPVISYQRAVTPWDGTLKVAKCADLACAGGGETITTLDTTGGPTFESTSIAMGLDANPVIAYLNIAESSVRVAKCNDPACAGGDETVTVLQQSTGYMQLSMTLAPDGNPLVSYMGSLRLARCNDPACAGGDESIATVDDTVGARVSSIATGADGLPVIVYSGDTGGALRVVHCGTPECK